MKKWTWQWLVLLAILGMLFSFAVWMDRQPYYIYEDFYKPDTPWKQMIWEARENVDFGLRIADLKSIGHPSTRPVDELRSSRSGQIGHRA